MRRSCLIISLLVINTTLLAQRLVEREIIVNPMFKELPSSQSDSLFWMSSISGWGGFGYYVKGDPQHAWNQKLGVVIELFRNGEQSSFAFESNIEFVANDRNNIGFKPAAMFWEEGFLYTLRLNTSFLQIGYYHRCKHDIDNLIPGYERRLIFGGLLFKYIMPVLEQNTEQSSFLALRTEIYTIRQDDRIPEEYMEIDPSLMQLLGTIALNFNGRKSITKSFGLYLLARGSLNFFGHNTGFWDRFNSLQTVQFNGGLSAGFTVEGGAHFRVGLNYEYFSDNLIDPYPVSSTLLSVGVMVIDPGAML